MKKSSSVPLRKRLPKKLSYSQMFKKTALPATVFITGACVLIIEIVATRILSPYFGNTIFTVSSVISIVLAALSLGYVIGGKLADRRPERVVFYSVIAASGVSVLLLQMLNNILLPSIGYKLPITSGPLVSAIILFFLPSLLLGMLSPFAIKLQSISQPKKGIGSVAGEIFFWSTLGSIFGSLSSGFLLIPHFGISAILISVGITLTALGLLPLLRSGSRNLIVVIIVLGVMFSSFTSASNPSIVYVKDGTYEKIKIFDGTYQGQATRFFQQDRSTSGAMFLSSDDLVYDYTKYYSLYQLFKPDISNALVIGGGAYSIPKKLLQDLPDAAVDVSEIEPSLFNLGKKYFNVPNEPRLHNYTDDGRRLLSDTNKKYDMIFGDVFYSLYSIPAHFTTGEFFKLAKSKLSTDGVFMANIIGSLSRQSPSLLLSEMRTFQEAFPNSYFFAVDSNASLDTQNIIFVGFNSDHVIDLNSPEVTESQNDIIRNLPSHVIDPTRFELSAYAKLTDDFSPVEKLSSIGLERSFVKGDSIRSGNEMLAIIAQQLRYGPRYLSSDGHKKIQDFIEAEMKTFTPNVTRQTWTDNSGGSNQELTNIIGRYNPDLQNRIILAAHYDSKRYASLDRKSPNAAMPGADDSASGVAELLEFARNIATSKQPLPVGVDIIFFDGEEGNETIKNDYSSWQPLGSTYFANNLNAFYPGTKPTLGIVLDMVCDKNLHLQKEPTSSDYARDSVDRFWDIGKSINPGAFSNNLQQRINDDHTVLNNAGIPSMLIIDFDYPPFHTTKDTLDKCSAKSLQTVGDTLSNFVYTIQ